MKTKRRALRVLFVTPECSPWIKAGGLGDVSAALPAALAALGVDVRVLLPAYPAVLRQAKGARRVATLEPEHGLPGARLLRARLPSGVVALLLDCPPLYQRPGGAYQDDTGSDYADNALRFGLLSRVAALLASARSPLPWRAEVLHCNDWPTALAPAWLALGLPEPAASLISVHNLAFHGLFPLDTAAALGLPSDWLGTDGVEYWGKLSFLKAGLVFADRICAVSPTYAREILEEANGCGLDGLLRARRDRLDGILNGIDCEEWNPATDPHLAQRYDAGRLAAKRGNKRALQAELGLQADDGATLLGLVSRLTGQKGIDLVLEALPALFERPVQLAVLGSGEAQFEHDLLAATARFPGRLAVVIDFDEGLAHRIEGGADAFLMPSRFEPCGLNQMYSQRYGTPPIVRATGGLCDSVVDCSEDGLRSGASTGFVFAGASAQALLETVDRALALRAQPARWRTLCRNGMARDFSWQAPAQAYLDLYERMLAGR